jgi:hypothetical protein
MAKRLRSLTIAHILTLLQPMNVERSRSDPNDDIRARGAASSDQANLDDRLKCHARSDRDPAGNRISARKASYGRRV